MGPRRVDGELKVRAQICIDLRGTILQEVYGLVSMPYPPELFVCLLTIISPHALVCRLLYNRHWFCFFDGRWDSIEGHFELPGWWDVVDLVWLLWVLHQGALVGSDETVLVPPYQVEAALGVD
jgi:hypothetical protein